MGPLAYLSPFSVLFWIRFLTPISLEVRILNCAVDAFCEYFDYILKNSPNIQYSTQYFTWYSTRYLTRYLTCCRVTQPWSNNFTFQLRLNLGHRLLAFTSTTNLESGPCFANIWYTIPKNVCSINYFKKNIWTFILLLHDIVSFPFPCRKRKKKLCQEKLKCFDRPKVSTIFIKN